MERELRIGSLCTGYGGLDIAALAVFGGTLVWCADNDKHVSTILAARYPDVPNLGDLTTFAWARVPTVDILCAGFPCQDISTFPGNSPCCSRSCCVRRRVVCPESPYVPGWANHESLGGMEWGLMGAYLDFDEALAAVELCRTSRGGRGR